MPCESYAVEASADYFEAFDRLPSGYQNRIRRLLDHLRTAPRAPFPGLKQLRGQHAGIWEYRVSAARGALRLNYTIDDEQCAVRIEYLGPHPEYAFSRGRGY